MNSFITQEEVDEKVISQRDNFSSNFGIVLRSSAIFYYKVSNTIKTTISFMNYWKFKRDIEVCVIASTRTMEGKLILREQLTFDKGEVVNYRPSVQSRFEGSVEIEVFSTKNMAIPYAAIMAVYESEKGISMVHSYSRTYSPHEIEEGRTIQKGDEACWTIRDDKNTRSFCVLHNGGSYQEEQAAVLKVIGPENEYKEVKMELPELPPYSTFKVYPSKYIENLSEWLGNSSGNASISFHVKGAFTRLLIGNEYMDGSDLQVTHSNFNYSIKKTDYVDSNDNNGYMRVPGCGVENKEVIVYPESDRGRYIFEYNEVSKNFKTGDRVIIPVDRGTVKFKKIDGSLPTRLVTGLICNNTEFLPAETSLGIATELRPKKRFWWALVASDARIASKLIVENMPELSGEEPIEVTIRLFSYDRKDYIERKYDSLEFARHDFSNGVAIEEIFPNAKEYLNGDFGYITLFSEYGGLQCFTMLENEVGSYTLEHGF